MNSGTDLLDSITGWLEKHRLRWLDAAQQIDIPLVLEGERPFVVFDEAGDGSSVNSEIWTFNSLRDYAVQRVLEGRVGHSPLDSTSRALAAELFKLCGDRCFFWEGNMSRGRRSPDFDSDPVVWIEQVYFPLICEAYLREIANLASPNIDLAKGLGRDLLDFASRTDLIVRTSIPMGHIWTEVTSIVSGPARLRRLTPHESGEFVEPASRIARFTGVVIPPATLRKCLIEGWPSGDFFRDLCFKD